MTAQVISPRLMLIAEIMAIFLFIFTMGVGLYHLFTRRELGGGDLIAVCILIMTYVNVLRFQLAQASARIDELEKKLATSGTTDV